ncbi:MAG: hypothetical protein IT373_23820 [Polyangiaceae bacterium]|nr:hypothetical protein [Polyangiaceae bacterium]
MARSSTLEAHAYAEARARNPGIVAFGAVVPVLVDRVKVTLQIVGVGASAGADPPVRALGLAGLGAREASEDLVSTSVELPRPVRGRTWGEVARGTPFATIAGMQRRLRVLEAGF